LLNNILPQHEKLNSPVWSKIVVVLDEPGQWIADITADTKVIAIVGSDDEPPLTGRNNRKYRPWYNGGMEIISVRELENRLNAAPINQTRHISSNFLSNIPKKIQNIIKTQPFTRSENAPIKALAIAWLNENEKS
jgi:hypothetical protein